MDTLHLFQWWWGEESEVDLARYRGMFTFLRRQGREQKCRLNECYGKSFIAYGAAPGTPKKVMRCCLSEDSWEEKERIPDHIIPANLGCGTSAELSRVDIQFNDFEQ
jgi:hypothetical protein